MSTKKAERQRKAQSGAAKLIGKRALTLSHAMLRVDALSDELYEVSQRFATRNETADALLREAVEAMKRMELTDLSRGNAIFNMMLAALYPVVEKWREWRFADPVVDKLLQDQKVDLLKKYRHVVFHADHYDDSRLKEFIENASTAAWAAQLAAAFRDYLRRWHSDPVSHISEHLRRTGT